MLSLGTCIQRIDAFASQKLGWEVEKFPLKAYGILNKSIEAAKVRLRNGIKCAESSIMKLQKTADKQSLPPLSRAFTNHDASVTRLQQVVQHLSSSIMGSTSTPRESSKLFSPLRLGEMNLEHRVIMSPMTRLRCLGGFPTPVVTEYYTQRATKGGLLITEGMHPSLMVRCFYLPERVTCPYNVV